MGAAGRQSNAVLSEGELVNVVCLQPSRTRRSLKQMLAEHAPHREHARPTIPNMVTSRPLATVRTRALPHPDVVCQSLAQKVLFTLPSSPPCAGLRPEDDAVIDRNDLLILFCYCTPSHAPLHVDADST